jgi:anti-anti-sigma regulatory factor
MTTTTIRPPRTITPVYAPSEVAVTLPERLDVHQLDQLRHQLRQLELGRGHRVALDGSMVAHADQSGLELLVEAQGHCDDVGARLTLTNTSLALRLAIELTGIAGTPVQRDEELLVDLFAEAA